MRKLNLLFMIVVGVLFSAMTAFAQAPAAADRKSTRLNSSHRL